MLAGNSVYSAHRHGVDASTVGAPVTERRRVPTADALLDGDLTIPAGAGGVVVLADHRGSRASSERRQGVAEKLIAGGIATLRLELITDQEQAVGGGRFGAVRLGDRLIAAIDWLDVHRELRGVPVGCFGEGAGAAAGLVAAAERSGRVRAVVACGRHRAVARGATRRVTAPTLLVVQSDDGAALTPHRADLDRLGGEAQVRVASRGEQIRVCEQVSGWSADWFSRWLVAASAAAATCELQATQPITPAMR